MCPKRVHFVLKYGSTAEGTRKPWKVSDSVSRNEDNQDGLAASTFLRERKYGSKMIQGNFEG